MTKRSSSAGGLGSEGSILAWVLVSSIVLMIICASLARVILMRAQQTQRQGDTIAATKQDNLAVARLMSAWSQGPLDQRCSTTQSTLVGYTTCAGAGCTPGGGAGPCTLSGAATLPCVRVTAAGTVCAWYDPAVTPPCNPAAPPACAP